MGIVEFEGVSKNYQLGKVTVPALKNVNLTIEKGDFITVRGPSGSGKSTLLNLVGMIDEPTNGKIWIDGEEADHQNDKQMTRLRKKYIGFIFQNFSLIPVLNVFENIEYPILKSGLDLNQRKELIRSLLKEVGLDGYEKRLPGELSGGQQQRVAAARAFAKSPKIVLADEPTANLDRQSGKTVIDMMRRINHEFQTTFILATHDAELISGADKIIQVLDGVVEEGDIL